MTKRATVPALILLDGVRLPNGQLIKVAYQDEMPWRIAHTELRVAVPVEVQSPLALPGGAAKQVQMRVARHPVPCWEIIVPIGDGEAFHYQVAFERAYVRTPMRLVETVNDKGEPVQAWRPLAEAQAIEEQRVEA